MSAQIHYIYIYIHIAFYVGYHSIGIFLLGHLSLLFIKNCSG